MRLENNVNFVPSMRELVGVMPSEDHTSIELSGTDRPGLLSEVCAILADIRCNIVNADVWTHNARAAAVDHVTDYLTGCAIQDPKRLLQIKGLLCNVLRGNNDLKEAKMTVFQPRVTNTERGYTRLCLLTGTMKGLKELDLGELRTIALDHM